MAKYRRIDENVKRAAIIELQTGKPVAEVCSKYGISKQALYLWRQTNGINIQRKTSPGDDITLAIEAFSTLYLKNGCSSSLKNEITGELEALKNAAILEEQNVRKKYIKAAHDLFYARVVNNEIPQE